MYVSKINETTSKILSFWCSFRINSVLSCFHSFKFELSFVRSFTRTKSFTYSHFWRLDGNAEVELQILFFLHFYIFVHSCIMHHGIHHNIYFFLCLIAFVSKRGSRTRHRRTRSQDRHWVREWRGRPCSGSRQAPIIFYPNILWMLMHSAIYTHVGALEYGLQYGLT